MVHTATVDSGAEEWSCTRCSRRLLFRWPPSYQKVVLDRGDEQATHTGGKGGLRASAQVMPAGPTALAEDDHAWLDAHGIQWHDGKASEGPRCP